MENTSNFCALTVRMHCFCVMMVRMHCLCHDGENAQPYSGLTVRPLGLFGLLSGVIALVNMLFSSVVQ